MSSASKDLRMKDFEIEPKDVQLELHSGCARLVDTVIEILPMDVHNAWDRAAHDFDQGEYALVRVEASRNLKMIAAKRFRALYRAMSAHEKLALQQRILERREARRKIGRELARKVAQAKGRLH